MYMVLGKVAFKVKRWIIEIKIACQGWVSGRSELNNVYIMEWGKEIKYVVGIYWSACTFY